MDGAVIGVAAPGPAVHDVKGPQAHGTQGR
jgi:hypothetical protein